MPEFTLRNKTSPRPILTLRPAVFKAMLAARPESSSLALAMYTRAYKNVTGKEVSLDHAQQMRLLERYGADESGAWKSPYSKLPPPWYVVEKSFIDGFLGRTSTSGFLDDLAIAEAFYSLLETQLVKHP